MIVWIGLTARHCDRAVWNTSAASFAATTPVERSLDLQLPQWI
jgi:hypothetical protein